MEEWFFLYGEYLLPVVFFCGIAFLLIRQYCLNRAPEYVGEAKVVSRRMEPGKYHGRWSSGWNYLVTFQLGNDTIELYVTEMDYAELTEGIMGMIRWQNGNLLCFDPTP